MRAPVLLLIFEAVALQAALVGDAKLTDSAHHVSYAANGCATRPPCDGVTQVAVSTLSGYADSFKMNEGVDKLSSPSPAPGDMLADQ